MQILTAAFRWMSGRTLVVVAAGGLVVTMAAATSDRPSLWVAQSQGVTQLDPDGAAALADHAVSTGARAVAVDRDRGRV